ncbi:MAG: type II toxin-antitoxin system death-on-curing family toxin [Nitrospirales bacterium]|jgi:death-on-curing protein|nr:MAG: type II toxin-antitoxin system death-on-curing family toxin [Nitrospirales bacterium]
MKEPVWILHQSVLAIHDVLLAEFGGAPGIRDESLLDSALGRPLNLWSYEKPNLFRLAAAYTHGIVKNHPFVDGNKRTGYVIGGIFLERNGQNLNASEEEATAAIMALASNSISEDDFTHWLQDNCE